MIKVLIYFTLAFFSLLSLPALAQEQQVVVPYTLADRDRAILTEAKILMTMLREYSKKHPDLAEILRTHGVL